MVMDTDSRLLAPIHLLSSTISCYRCDEVTTVYCVAATGLSDEDVPADLDPSAGHLIRLSNVEELDRAIVDKLGVLAPAYRVDRSATQGRHVWMNHCLHCGAKQGDFFLHNEPDGPFFAYDGGGQVVREQVFATGSFTYCSDLNE